ncbi:MAG TPA: nuclear transport factor 2 family protein [Phycisphaerae bacterium]|nr:nuclear transport factor 2 family protein [Phycisphaerae bacterium]
MKTRPGCVAFPEGRAFYRLPVLASAALAAMLLPGGCGRPAVDHADIRAVLARQTEAWNHGDIEGFMQAYWKSDQTVFRSPKGETHGWEAVLDRYKQSYPTPEKMGRLAFEGLQISQTGEDKADVSGRYRLETGAGRAGIQTGRFYLTMRRIDGAWLIVNDYTVGG